MTQPDCLFCDIYQKREGIIYEDPYFYAQFDAFPISPGHAEVIPKRHVVSLLDLEPPAWNGLLTALKGTVKVIESTNMRALYEAKQANPLNKKAAWYCGQMLASENVDRKPEGYNFGNNDGEAAGRTIHHLHVHVIPRYYGDLDSARGGIRGIIPHLRDYLAK